MVEHHLYSVIDGYDRIWSPQVCIYQVSPDVQEWETHMDQLESKPSRKTTQT